MIINFSFEEESLVKIYRISSLITSLIIFGIILGIRSIFETLGMFLIFRILNNDLLYFAIMVSIFFFLHKPFLGKFGFSQVSNEERQQNYKFNKIFIVLIIIAWVLSAFFLSITLLQIPLRDPLFPNYPDKFALGVLWSFSVVFICILLTSIINKSLSDEKRIEKKVLKNSMYGAGMIAFCIWFIQLVIFEVYLHKWLGFQVIKQDIRVLFIVVSGLYITIFFNLLKGKFLPEASEKSSERVKELLDSELKKRQIPRNTDETEPILEDQDSIPIEISEQTISRFSQGISLKSYVYLLKKFNNSQSIDDNTLLGSKFNKKSNKIIAGLIWVIPIIVISIVRMLDTLLVEVIFLSCMSALLMVVGDLSLTFLFNKINPVGKRTSKILLQQTALFGGMITFWIWLIPFFVIYLYLFILINDIIILNLAFITILSIAMFALSSKIIWWYATSIKMWDAAMKNRPYVKKKAAKVALVLFIYNIASRVYLFIQFSGFGFYPSRILSVFWADDVWPTEYDRLIPILYIEFLIIVSNIIIAMIHVKKVYKRKFIEYFKFVITSLIVVYLATIGVTLILGLFQSLIITYHYSFTDLRIPLIVASGIYTISIFGSQRIQIIPDTSEKMGDRFRAALEPYEEDQLQGPMAERREILNVQDLTTYFYTEEGIVKAVESVSFKINEGETLGLVGETGCGKSVTALSILRLVRPPGEIKGGRVYFEGEDLYQKTEEEFLKYRGNRITMIFQDPLNSLNPVYKIGAQIAEVYRLHMENELLIEATKTNTSIYEVARKWSRKLLKDLNIPTPRIIFDRYPHELSGGMRQRVQIAMGLACSPTLLIADEPTTALDVTIQNQILQLMKDLKKKYNTSILFITHDLGIISKMCDRVAVMYSGFIVEYGDIEKLFITPYHPYTRGLISAVPVIGKKKELLDVIPGMVPNLIYPPSGCRFHPRCQYCFEPCDSEIPKSIEIEPDYFVACHLYNPEYKDLAEISIRKAENEILDK